MSKMRGKKSLAIAWLKLILLMPMEATTLADTVLDGHYHAKTNFYSKILDKLFNGTHMHNILLFILVNKVQVIVGNLSFNARQCCAYICKSVVGTKFPLISYVSDVNYCGTSLLNIFCAHT